MWIYNKKVQYYIYIILRFCVKGDIILVDKASSYSGRVKFFVVWLPCVFEKKKKNVVVEEKC